MAVIKIIPMPGVAGTTGLQGIQGIQGPAGSGSGSGSPLSVQQTNANGIAVESYSNINTLQFDEATGFNVTSPANGIAKVSLGSSFKYWNLNGVSGLVAEGEDTVNFVPGDNIQMSMEVVGSTQKNFIIGTSPDVVTKQYLDPMIKSLGPISVTGASAVVLDSWDITSPTATEYLIHIVQGSKHVLEKVLVLADINLVNYTKYGILANGGNLFGPGVSAVQNGNTAMLIIQISNADLNNASVKVLKTAIS